MNEDGRITVSKFLASHTRARVESCENVAIISCASSSLLTRMYELKEPVCNPLIFNVLDLPFREPVTFILYVSVQRTRFAESTHTVFDSHLDINLVQAYEIPLLGNPLVSFPSFVLRCFVVTSQLYHFHTRSQDFFETFLYFF